MLYRFREAQAAQLGLAKTRQRRPGFAGSVTSITEADMWRRDLLSEISRKIAKIQDGKKRSMCHLIVMINLISLFFCQSVYLIIKCAI